MTLKDLASALQSRRVGAKEKGGTAVTLPDAAIVSIYTRCEQCGRPLFMDDRLIVEQCTSVEKFLDRCAKRSGEHRCDSGSKPQF